jgi:outer membrane protein assembly factor BamD (BamD/ComL family)
MKNLALFLLTLAIALPCKLYSQDKRAIKAAEMSFNSAENDLKKQNTIEAAKKLDIVVNTIPANIDSRKHVEMRLDALIYLVDIYFYKDADFTQACNYLDMYMSTMNTIKNTGVLKPSVLLKYLKQEQDYASKEVNQCKNYKGVGKDMDKFRKTFESEFDED